MRALQLDMKVDDRWNVSLAGARWLTTDGGVEKGLLTSAAPMALAPADAGGVQGLAFKIHGAGANDLWLEAGMLACPDRGEGMNACGFGQNVDFDWFFGDSATAVQDGVADGATDPSILRLMQEAQARVVSVSPAIAFPKEH